VRPDPRRAGGFTLLEVLAVVLLTSMVIGLSLDFYIEMSQRIARATEFTREIRRATTILDRVARDFEHAILLRKPPEADPLTHPWVFVAESRGSALGADRIKFSALGQMPASTRSHASDFAVISYLTRSGPDGGVDLLRWSSPHLPESLDREFPLPEDEGVQLMAEGLADFGVRFLDAAGEWIDRWDSSTLVDSSELPLAVEIHLALAPGEQDGEPDGLEPVEYSRTVLLPLRPFEPEDLTGAPPGGEGQAGAGEEGEADGDPLPSAEEMIERERRLGIEEDGR